MSGYRIVAFLFEGESTLRVIYREGAPWFVLPDVCQALGLINPSPTADGLDEDEKGVSTISTLRGDQEMPVVSEDGLFTLILRCCDAMKKGTLPHRFRQWVTSEVLPSIHKRAGEVEGMAAPPEALKVRLVTECRQTFGPRSAAQLWFTLDLPTVPAMNKPPAQADLFMRWTAPCPPSNPSPN